MNKLKAYSQQTGHHANLKLLIWLRAVAIAGQLTAVVIAKNYLGISLQTDVLYAWIGIYAFINLLTISRFYTKTEINKWEFFAHLIFDIIILLC